MSRANGQVLHYRRDRSRMVRIPWRLQDLYVSGQRLQQQRTQNGLPPLSDRSIAVRLKVSPQRWLDACTAEVSKKIMGIEDLDLQPPLAAPIQILKRSGFKVFSLSSPQSIRHC